jgi:hypothetical protein
MDPSRVAVHRDARTIRNRARRIAHVRVSESAHEILIEVGADAYCRDAAVAVETAQALVLARRSVAS